jgi:hypothetical protein
MSRKMILGTGLLVCLLVAQTSTAGTSAALSPRNVSIVGGQWTWAGGFDLPPDSGMNGVYGTKGVAAPGNRPGVRKSSVSWTDASGNLWLFGGEGDAAWDSGWLNDLWKWDGTNWTWVSGSDGINQQGTYGAKGVAAPANVPGARYGSTSWTDASGNLWLFGGYGYPASSAGRLNDLWKWDGTSWTWVSGSDGADQHGTYGTRKVTAPGNVPGARDYSVSWTDASGNLWLFGGWGNATTQDNCFLNDLWKWDGTNWTWVSGSNDYQQNPYGTYGTKGVAAPGNVPGGRADPVSWKDASGNLWLFGGLGYSATTFTDLNDLWKWDGTNWTWVSGSDVGSQYGTYGTKGVAAPGNVPGARESSISWIDATGNLWLFGGDGGAASTWGHLNDLWKWDGTNWTWVSGSNAAGQYGTYGTRGVAASGNVPGGRETSISWIDPSGHLWLFGGDGIGADRASLLNDLWKWNGTNWTWMSGSDAVLFSDVKYGTKGVAAPGNFPGSRSGSVSWTDAGGNFWLFGGEGGLGRLNDLWKWDGTNWAWMSGADAGGQHGTYGTKGVAAPGNVPGARIGSVSWTDAAGSLWLFGGYGFDETIEGVLNDLWKWDGTSWTWVSGSNGVNQYGTYGTKGIAAAGNVPGARWAHVSWADPSGNLWLFGGGGNAASSAGRLNDLWKWDGTSWTWMSGSNAADQSGTYGTKGIAEPANVPGGRWESVSWTDGGGSLWLFGGHDSLNGNVGNLNDLWKWDGSNWTWVSGSDGMNQYGTYGTKGVAAPGNVPGARCESVGWKDANGDFWLFGGFGLSSSDEGGLNDLWRWDGTNWTWVSGSVRANQNGTYGTLGAAAPGNVPGARYQAVSWTDTNGNGWLFGGTGYDSGVHFGSLGDLWAFGTTCSSLAPPTAANGGPYGIGATITLTASTIDGATYLWTGPFGFTSTEQNPTIPNATLAMAGAYSVTIIVGGCPSGAGTTTVVVLPSPTLAVTKIGSGTGSVSSSPAGIDCGATCSASFPALSQVTLTATPVAGSRFAGWSGEGCGGTDPCNVTMDAAKSLSATFLPAGGIGFHTLTPCRIVDTRNAAGPWGGPALDAGTARAFEIAGRCGVPADAAAIALNVTVTNPTSAGSLTVYPGTGVVPGTSTVSFAAGRTRANNVTIGLIGGFVTVLDRQETGTTNVIVDVSGYFR